MVVDEVRTIIETLTFLIRSVVSSLGAIKNLWENAPTAEKCLQLGCLSLESDQTKNLKATYSVQTLGISLKYCKRVAPEVQIFGQNSFWGLYFPRFCPDKCEIWHGRADVRSAPSCQISRLSGQRVASAGRKPHFWTTE